MNSTQFLLPEAIAPLLARVLLGIIFAMQGYDKIFNVKIPMVIETIATIYETIKLPRFLIVCSAYLTSYIEFGCGLMLVVGIYKYTSLYLLGADLIFVSLGLAILNPVWDMKLVFPRFIILLFLLLYPAKYDVIMLQNLLLQLK